ncbi:hypothetical protein [Streptomyces sp. NPDC094032]|uniref:hypothetical protein n=1 Tax=Streptomyces sp. NPDC094032 TaxID=3155308 RepID=UPI00331AFA8A
MSEMDMTVKHQELTVQTEEMKQLAQQMKNELSEIVQALASMKDSFSGEAAAEFDQFAQTVQRVDGELSINFDAGAAALTEAHDIVRNGDRKSAFHFQR